ncbi:transient receptor potential cation channel subfamily V member 6 [Diorhabda sublineata]|uniref:transient receptor potential cation channel subfamily V member 6 n=1 Tax=Diorhabda sublineata TaxID=1163346 RepID=UPI0024E1868B|nr:transient receptor potential cation channel subfamily V member 6 [Diorhabda sublineata]
MGGSNCKPCRKKKKNLQGGSILDRVISQSSNQDQCLLYKLANYKKGGELIEAYNQGGQVEVEKLIREQFGQLMYQEGKSQIINRSEYLRWKFRDYEQVTLPIEASLSRYDPLGKWEDHEACWQMQYRGSLGETLLHVLIMCDTKIHTRLARTLIKCFPKLALDVVEGEEYLGASALHLAIAYNNNELVQDLVEAGANVNQRAIGSFFLPRDQQRPKPAKHTDYEGLAYLGEYPLAWAACCANESVYNLLLDSGANPDYQDNFGNMILHMVVVCDKLDMFGYALRHPKLPASNGIVNKAGLTPLTLACKLGRAEVFREMLELSAKEFWRYSNITCSAYTLNALDTLLPDGSTNWNSALFIILNGTKEAHLDMLDGGIIQRLLEEKWKTFARNQFLKRLLILVVHLIFLSLAVYMRPDDPDVPLLEWSDDPATIARYSAEVGTILGVLSYVILQQGDEIRNQGIWAFLKQQSNSPPKTIFLLSNLLILCCIPFRLSGDRNTEEAILLFAVPGSWFLLMFFAGAVRLTGPFVTMIYSMITGDMLTFGIIYTIVLFGFSQSFFFLYKGFPGVNSTLYYSYPSTWMALFQITLGNYDYQELGSTTYPGVAKTVFALFMVFVPILLLNMLIAMMGNTYAHVIEQSEKEWMKQWAKIVIALERAIPQADAHHYLQEYSISLGGGDDPNTELRGVMVIKSKNKTRAKQRKGAVANWKRVGKVTINALKKKGMTGEEMRCLMWGRESINTPIKTKGKNNNPYVINPQGPDLTGGFGDALSSALDVMAFTHEVDINGASPHPDPIPASSVNSNLLQQIPINSPKVEDPLRELVLCEEKDADPEKLKFLALSAANLVKEEPSPKQSSQSTSINVKALAGIFVGTETLIKKVEENLKKKFAALDPSDSEGFGEAPLLGKVSRTRRSQSAHLRNSSAKSRNSDKRKLFLDSDSSISDTTEIISTRENKEKNFTEAAVLQSGLEVLDVAMGEPDLSISFSETVTIQGIGSGVETESGNVKIRTKKKKRPATGKTNRVTPALDQRPCKSAKTTNGGDDSDNISSPDPLEPWSTKSIANMNSILAWQNEDDSL